ncbi:MAG: ABC transporter substrate-binding protein [Bacillota bacterium]
MKKLFLVFSLVAFAIGIVGCTADTTAETTEGTETTEETTEDQGETVSPDQGVTDTSILVGNTAAVTGVFAGVGVPFNDAIKAVFEEVNDNGGIDGREIEFISYNDEFNANKGVTFTETLVEQDNVFALVGHFGTPTVGATIDYIQDTGVPMVYAATGINALYFEESVGNPVMPVQPIYLTDGRIMAARALTEEVYGVNGDRPLAEDAKIGVLYTNDDVGNSIREGIEIEMDVLGVDSSRVEYIVASVDTMSSAITDLFFKNVDVAILAMNQGPFGAAISEMANQSLRLPVFTSYVNADPSYLNPDEYSENRPIFTNAWVDVFSAEGQAAVAEFATTITNASFLDEETKTAYMTNSYAIAGFIAARVFVEGLERVAANGEELNWDNYIAAMEEGPIDIPMGGVVDFSGGKRWGIASMALLKYYVGDNPATEDVIETDFETFNQIIPIETIEEIEAKYEE